ncbi:MAG: hypothetical protein IT251_04185 [Chitinophagaceae bacterium]|nr:hypothetical protein [Chitinophagaceae bacterium]
MIKQNNAKGILVAFLIFALSNNIQSQTIIGSEVYGVSPIAPDKTGASMVDENWGLLPSMQGNGVDMWGRNITNMQNVEEPIIVDSTNELTGTTSVDFDEEPPPPPDDPEDIPLDGGTTVLLAIAAGLEYKRRKIKKPTDK